MTESFIQNKTPEYVSNRYQFLNEELINEIRVRGPKLIQTFYNNFDTAVFLDRSSRPISWIFKALSEKYYPYFSTPPIINLNTGQKNFREKYMKGIGSSIDEKNIPQFVGIFDTDSNIEIFKEKIRNDTETLNRIKNELGNENFDNLHKRSVLIIDDTEFEGVQRLFCEEALNTIYQPSEIGYFEWGEIYNQTNIPNGLSQSRTDSSFIAKNSNNLTDLKKAKTVKSEIERFIKNDF